MKHSHLHSLLVVACVVAIGTTIAKAEQRIAFPVDYQNTFVNYLSLDRTQHPDQLIRLFATQETIDAVKKTGEFPNGSVLVAEVYKAKKDADGNVITSDLGRRIRGKFAVIAVMEKQSGWGDTFPAELKNADWDFATFKPDGSLAKKDLDSCRRCHAPLVAERHVFSYQHLR